MKVEGEKKGSEGVGKYKSGMNMSKENCMHV
jgi:hypothetical protein